jgi:ribosomal protein S27AE
MKKEHCKCGKIKENRDLGNCRECFAKHRRKWKQNNPLTEAQKERDKIARKLRDAKRLEGIRQRSPRLGAKPGILRPLCSWCNIVIENFKKKTFCKPCAAKYNREWRKKNPSTGEQKLRDNVRFKTYYAIKSGKLIRKPCEICGELKVQAHHDDYSKTYDVRWLCWKHHREFHDSHGRLNDSSGEND